MEKEKYMVMLQLQAKDKKELLERYETSIFVANVAAGALEVTEYPVFRDPDSRAKTQKHIFPYAAYEKISYELTDLKNAILSSFNGNVDAMSNWFAKQEIKQVDSRWRFEVELLGDKAVFVQGDFEEIDEIVDEVLKMKAAG